jgi:hypothetical protein
MISRNTFDKIVRYLILHDYSTPLGQVLADQINQPPIEKARDDLAGQRGMLYVAIVSAVVGVAAGIWVMFLS